MPEACNKDKGRGDYVQRHMVFKLAAFSRSSGQPGHGVVTRGWWPHNSRSGRAANPGVEKPTHREDVAARLREYWTDLAASLDETPIRTKTLGYKMIQVHTLTGTGAIEHTEFPARSGRQNRDNSGMGKPRGKK